MNESVFLDLYNIKSYPELLINFFKENNINNGINNLRGFYSKMLDSINRDIKESYLNRILKYLSSKEESTILVLEDIKDNIYEEELLIFFNSIASNINKTSNSQYFYNKLLKHCSIVFFNDEELNTLKNAFDNNKAIFLYLLFVHACSDYKINTPKIVAERLLYDAIALFDTTKLRNILLEESANLGNEIACALYGTIIYSDWQKRLDIFMKGKSGPINLWGIAFIIEHYELSNEQFNEIKKELKNIIDEGNKYVDNVDVINDNDPFHRECTITALKIYFYLANEKNYSKALCSVGKFFLTDKVGIIEDNIINREKSIEMGLSYSNRAIKLGNIHAMQNVGAYYYINDPNSNFKYKELLKIGASAKDVLSNIYTAKILIDEEKTDEAENYLKFLSDENSSEAFYKLGKIYEGRMQIEEAIKYYEKAIKNKVYSASIDLAKIYFTKYMNNESSSSTKIGYLLLAINLLEKNFSEYSLSEKEEATVLINNYKSLL